MGVAHPGLDRAERVFDQASSIAHGAGPQIHPDLEGVDDRLGSHRLIRRSRVGVHWALRRQPVQLARSQ